MEAMDVIDVIEFIEFTECVDFMDFMDFIDCIECKEFMDLMECIECIESSSLDERPGPDLSLDLWSHWGFRDVAVDFPCVYVFCGGGIGGIGQLGNDGGSIVEVSLI